MAPSADGAPSAQSIARVFLRPVASPLPLGFFAFGIGTLLLSALEIGVIPTRESTVVGMFLAAAVFPTEGAAALIAVLARDSPALTGLGLLAGSWLAVGLHFITGSPGTTSATLGVFALAIAGSLVLLSLAAVAGKRILAAAFLLAVARYVLLGLYQLTADKGLQSASGIVGLVLAGLSAYGGLALLAEEGAQRTILPVFRAGASKSSLEGGLDQQLERAEREPGVRAQL